MYFQFFLTPKCTEPRDARRLIQNLDMPRILEDRYTAAGLAPPPKEMTEISIPTRVHYQARTEVRLRLRPISRQQLAWRRRVDPALAV